MTKQKFAHILQELEKI